MTQRRILVVEDEKDISDLVALHLGDLCDELQSASDGHEGMRLATWKGECDRAVRFVDGRNHLEFVCF